MVIKRSGARELRGESAAFGDQPASSMSKYSPAWTLTSEMVHFVSKSVTLSMYIDAGDDLHGFDHISWPLTSEIFTFWKCLQWSYLKIVSVPLFVLGRLRGSTATSGSCRVYSHRLADISVHMHHMFLQTRKDRRENTLLNTNWRFCPHGLPQQMNHFQRLNKMKELKTFFFAQRANTRKQASSSDALAPTVQNRAGARCRDDTSARRRPAAI